MSAQGHRHALMTRAPRQVGAVLAGVVLAACSAVPASGPVQRGPAVRAAEDAGVIRVIARPPAADMTPVEIVRGFLAANATLSDVSVARQFLTSAAAQSWRPTGISVVRGVLDVVTADEDTITVAGALDGVIDVQDRWQPAAQGATLTVPFRLAQERGQWRIAELPSGLIVTRTAADRALRTYDIHFLAPGFTRLVPEQVTVPVLGAGLATTLMRRLLDGPSEWLAPAVTTAFPEGTRLALESVPVINGVARVELTEEVLTADGDTRRALSAQLVRTLAPVPGISSVRITVGGTPLAVPGAGAVQSIGAWASFGPDVASRETRAFLVRDGVPVALALGDEEPTVVGGGLAGVAEIAVSADGRRIAAVSEGRDALLAGPLAGPVPVVYAAAGLTSPVLVGDGVWVVRRGVGVIALRSGRAVVVPVTTADGTALDGLVTALEVARDGTRAALVVRQDGRSRLLVARIEASDGAPRLAAARRIENSLGDVVDIAWQGASRLAVLHASGAAGVRLTTVRLGLAVTESLDVPTGAARIAAGPERSLLVGAIGPDVLLVRAGGRWSTVTQGSEPVWP